MHFSPSGYYARKKVSRHRSEGQAQPLISITQATIINMYLRVKVRQHLPTLPKIFVCPLHDAWNVWIPFPNWLMFIICRYKNKIAIVCFSVCSLMPYLFGGRSHALVTCVTLRKSRTSVIVTMWGDVMVRNNGKKERKEKTSI